DLSDIGSPRADDHEHFELPGMLEDPYVEVALHAPPSPDYIPGPEEPEQAPPLPDYIRCTFIRDTTTLPISAPTSPPPLQLPSANHKEDRPEVTLPPRKRLGIALGPGYKVGDSSSAAAARPAGGLRADYGFVATIDREIRHDLEREVGYGITNSWDAIVETLQGAPVSTDTELGGYIREFETRVRRDTDEIYSRLDDEQSERQLLDGWLNILFRDRCTHAFTRHLIETKASEVTSLRTAVLGQTTEIRELHAVDRKRHIVTSEMLRADHRRFAEIRGLRTDDRTCDHTTRTGDHTTGIGDSPTGIGKKLEKQLPSASRREDRPEVTLPPRKRLDIALGPRYEVGESSSAAAARPAGGFRADYGFVATVDREIMRNPEREVGYGITDSWDEILETLHGAPVSTYTELDGYVREFETRVRQDMDEIYMRLDDEQTERQLLAGRLNMLFRDRRAHAYTRQLMETEARMSREAWVRATDASDLVHSEVMSLRTTVLGQMSEIKELQAADRRRQTVISELLSIDHRRSIEISELRTALQGRGQQGLAGDHIQPELPEEAGGSA
nr:hypothetical protein [Tanacetum cinerariifolium]